jgi:hypothetical protein
MPDLSLPASSADLARLNEELASTAREVARLLTRPRYDEAELAELEVRARKLRAAIGRAHAALAPEEEPVILTCPGGSRAWLVSGG